MLIIGNYPAGLLMLVYLPEKDLPLVALVPFWSLPHLLNNSNRQPLFICTRCHAQPSGDICKAHELNVSKREMHLVEFKY